MMMGNVNIQVILTGTEHKKVFADMNISGLHICTLRGTHMTFVDDYLFVHTGDIHQTIENINEMDVHDFRVNHK